jgi:CheY-like chemotaxis protein
MADILIIDDEKAIRKALTEILSAEGYKTEEAGDGEEGLKNSKKELMMLCFVISRCQSLME